MIRFCFNSKASEFSENFNKGFSDDHKKRLLIQCTIHNTVYKNALKTYREGSRKGYCRICRGPCSWGPMPRANFNKRNCGRKHKSKNIDRNSIKNFT